MELGIGIGLTAINLFGAGSSSFSPSLNFTDSRNSQYVAVIF